eukprot:2269158-Rhodomonas_salina.1
MSVHARFGQDHPVACVARQDLQGEEPSAHASLSDSSLPNLGKRVRRSVHSSVHSGAHPSPSGKRVAKDCARDFGACSVTQLRQVSLPPKYFAINSEIKCRTSKFSELCAVVVCGQSAMAGTDLGHGVAVLSSALKQAVCCQIAGEMGVDLAGCVEKSDI